MVLFIAFVVVATMWSVCAVRAESICVSEAEHAYILQGHGALEAKALAEYDC